MIAVVIGEVRGAGEARPVRRAPAQPEATHDAVRAAGDRLELCASATRNGTSSEPGPDRNFLSRLWGGVRSFARGTGTYVHNLFDHREIWRNPALPDKPKDPGGLSVASYNIQLGGKHIDAAEDALRKLDADVVCLQEASLESAQRLAKNLGYHVAFATTALKPAGKVILSRYPIERVEDRAFKSVGIWQRLGAYYRESWQEGKYRETEPLAKRSVLHAQIRVGDRTVDILDTHLSLKDAQSNGDELREFGDLAASLTKSGHTVVAAGDFNTNFGLVGTPGKADPAGQVVTPTDTIEEFRARYPRSINGNIATPIGKAGADRLATELQSYWDAAATRTVIVDGKPMTPEEALAELAGGQVKAGSGRHLELLRAADGISHLGASKRFDNVFVSRDAHVERALIDQTSRGSDHQPVLADITW